MLDLEKLMDVMEKAVEGLPPHAAAGFSIGLVLKTVATTCNALEARIAELEKAPVEFKGTHESGRHYPKNSIVTHDGSMWIALRATSAQRPGEGGDAWQLCVKRGRDAR